MKGKWSITVDSLNRSVSCFITLGFWVWHCQLCHTQSTCWRVRLRKAQHSTFLYWIRWFSIIVEHLGSTTTKPPMTMHNLVTDRKPARSNYCLAFWIFTMWSLDLSECGSTRSQQSSEHEINNDENINRKSNHSRKITEVWSGCGQGDQFTNLYLNWIMSSPVPLLYFHQHTQTFTQTHTQSHTCMHTGLTCIELMPLSMPLSRPLCCFPLRQRSFIMTA